MTAESGLSLCAAEVRRHDPDRFATALLAPPRLREGLFTLYAFNLEIAKVCEVVSEPLLGEIRLQWWREAVEEAYAGRPRRHPVAELLGRLIAEKNLTRCHVDRLIDARAFDLRERPPQSVDALIDYAVGSSAQLVWLALEALEAKTDIASAAGREVGVGWALTGLLRALPFHLRAGRVYLPSDVMARHGVRTRDLMALEGSDPVRAAVQEIAERAAAHLRAARAHRAGVPKAALPALLPARLADIHLGRLRQAAFDPFDERLTRPLPFTTFRLAAAALRRHF